MSPNQVASPTTPPPTPLDWRKHFRKVSELDEGNVQMLIDGILPGEGVVFIGSLPGVGKSWIALSIARALRTGKPLFNQFKVNEVVPVVYCVPEMSSKAVRKRIAKLRIPDSDQFLVRTLKEGTLALNDSIFREMVKALKPVLILDTAIRFMNGSDENAAGANSKFANSVFDLLRLGARAVVCLHHSPKTAGKATAMTLENCLRGTGDFGAMSEVVWGVQRHRRKRGGQWDKEYDKESEAITRLSLECLKGRDIDRVADPFVIQGRPYIDESGDFALIERGGMLLKPDTRSREERLQDLVSQIEKDPSTGLRELTRITGWSTNVVKAQAATKGYEWTKESGWQTNLNRPAIELLTGRATSTVS